MAERSPFFSAPSSSTSGARRTDTMLGSPGQRPVSKRRMAREGKTAAAAAAVAACGETYYITEERLSLLPCRPTKQ